MSVIVCDKDDRQLVVIPVDHSKGWAADCTSRAFQWLDDNPCTYLGCVATHGDLTIWVDNFSNVRKEQ